MGSRIFPDERANGHLTSSELLLVLPGLKDTMPLEGYMDKLARWRAIYLSIASYFASPENPPTRSLAELFKGA